MLRRYQRGSVYKVGKQIKVWYGMFRVDQLKPDGSVARKQRNARLGTVQELPSKRAAEEALRKVMGTGGKPTTRMTFAELVERWKAAEIPAMKSSTAQHYRNALHPILPVFQAAEVGAITRHDLERFIMGGARRYSRSTLRSLRTTLSLILGYAARNEWIERNPVLGIRLPRAENCAGKPIVRSSLTPGQVCLLAEALAEPFSTLVVLLATTGLRIGGAAGLRWSDLDGDMLNVQRRVYCGSVDELKTKDSRRKLPLSDDIVWRLRRLRQGDFDSWIFRVRNGAPLNPGNWLKREVRPAARKLGIELTGWHDFRHFFATQLRRRGTHPKVLSALLGHSRVQLTMDVYDHADCEDLRGPLRQLLWDVTKAAVSC